MEGSVNIRLPLDCEQGVGKLAEDIAAFLASREQGYSVEVRTSVVHTRAYIGVSNVPKSEYFFIQLDTA